MNEAWTRLVNKCGGDPEAPDERYFGESAERCDELARGEDALCLIPLSQRGVMEIAGVDARRFLHGQSTCAVEDWTAGAAGAGAVCSTKGRIVANFALAAPTEERLLLTMPQSVVPGLQEALTKYIRFYKAEQTDRSEEFCIFGLLGANAAETAQQVFGAAPDPGECAEVDAGVLIRRDESRIECLVATDRALETCKALCDAGAQPCGAAVWTLYELRAGLVEAEGAVVEALLPQSLNLDCVGALNLTKGCYTGQEIIIRLQHRGRIKQRAFLLRGAAAERPEPGAEVHTADGKRACGTVLRAAPAAEGEWEMMAALPIEPPEELRLGAPDGAALKVLPLPYSVEL